MFNTR